MKEIIIVAFVFIELGVLGYVLHLCRKSKKLSEKSLKLSIEFNESFIKYREYYEMSNDLTKKLHRGLRKINGRCYEMDTEFEQNVPHGKKFHLPRLTGTMLRDLAKHRGVKMSPSDYLNK